MMNLASSFILSLELKTYHAGELDIPKLFQVQDISEAVAREFANVEYQVKRAKKMLSQINVEPNEDIDVHCHKPYDCAFWQYCSRHLPNQTVFKLYRMNFDKKVAHYKQGIVNFEQLSNESLNDKQRRQVECNLHDTIYINKVEIAKFLNTLSYPLYFLDFETIQPVIPESQGTHPYQQIPFQYSLHYIEKEGSLHNGGEAMSIFPKIKDMAPEEKLLARRSLLKYCELDTYAMVKVWQKLKEVAEA